MSTKGWRAADFMGLTPGIDPRRSDQLYALNGRNYLFDSRGAKSAFGDRMLTPYPIGKPQHAQGFRLRLRGGDRCFSMFGDGIFEWSETTGSWTVLYVTPDTTVTPYRWTYGYLNGYLYFCHPRTGILVMPIETDLVVPLDSVGMPDQPISIVIDNGRLGAMNLRALYWSAPSNGLDWVPREGGPGFQVINDRVAGDPIMITSYTGGILTWTTGGVMRSEFTGDVEVYRHRALNTEYRMINSFCWMKIDDNTVVIADERGLFETKGEAPKPFTPLFNEFLIDYLQKNKLRIGTNVRLEWDDLRRHVYLSVSLSESNPIYEKAFVLYPPLDKWGQFNELHYGILPLRIDNSIRADDFFGYVDSTGVVRRWMDVGSVEIVQVSNSLNSNYPLQQKPPHEIEGGSGIVFASSLAINTIENSNLLIPAGFFPRDGVVPVDANLGPLNASIQFGLVRFTGDATDTEISELTQLTLGSVISGDVATVVEDYKLIPDGTSNEDYNIVVGAEDFGFETLTYVNHKTRLIASMDGVSSFMEAIPTLVSFYQGLRNYSLSVNGIWFILELSATEIGEAFHLKVFELTAIPAGSL